MIVSSTLANQIITDIFNDASQNLDIIDPPHPIISLKKYINDNDNIIDASNDIEATLFNIIDDITPKLVENLYLTMDSYMNINYDLDMLQTHEWNYFYKTWSELWKLQTTNMIVAPIIKLQASIRRILEIQKWVRNLNEYNFMGCGFR